MNLIEHMRRAMAFSRATWGPGERTKGVCDHIRKELVEIETNPDDGRRSREWADVAILALDGMWRALAAEGVAYTEIPGSVAALISGKQAVNEQREWPDWRTQSPDKAIEHVRPIMSPTDYFRQMEARAPRPDHRLFGDPSE